MAKDVAISDGKIVHQDMEEPYNFTGLVVGRLSLEEIKTLIEGLTSLDTSAKTHGLVRSLTDWLEHTVRLDDKLGLEISLPLSDRTRRFLQRRG